jgi:hypothetical protein
MFNLSLHDFYFRWNYDNIVYSAVIINWDNTLML